MEMAALELLDLQEKFNARLTDQECRSGLDGE